MNGLRRDQLTEGVLFRSVALGPGLSLRAPERLLVSFAGLPAAREGMRGGYPLGSSPWKDDSPFHAPHFDTVARIVLLAKACTTNCPIGGSVIDCHGMSGKPIGRRPRIDPRIPHLIGPRNRGGQADCVVRVFPPPVIRAWRAYGDPEMAELADMAAATPLPLGRDFSAKELWRLAYREAVNGYLRAADAVGLFRGHPGRGLLSRLRASDPRSYRGAMAECITAWWFSVVMAHKLTPHPPGRPGKLLDLGVDSGESLIGVEVKSPYRPLRFTPGTVYTKYADDTDHLGAVLMCFTDAVAQLDPFPKEHRGSRTQP